MQSPNALHRTFPQHDDAPGVAWRGILAGLWLTSTMVILISFVPGIAISLGNLPGDIGSVGNGESVRLPIATITVLIVTLAGICYRISRFLSRL
ncbi:MAG: hypothetical protein H7X80_03420 [bacterium]|nr:hypothetical protein [Candidatus Kapabacteria bacterium]